MLATPLAAVFNSAISFFFPFITSYTGLKSLSTSTERFFFGRSFTCPSEAFTTNCLPRYLPIVFAFAGDSTMTRLFSINCAFRVIRAKQPKSYHAFRPPIQTPLFVARDRDCQGADKTL